MTKFIYNNFYGMKLENVMLLMLLLLISWGILEHTFRKKMWNSYWKILNVFIMVGILVAIFATTLISRGGTIAVCWIPFYSLKAAKNQPELYRSMLMNIFLFFPLGLSMPYVLFEKGKNKLLTICFAVILSVIIEFLQYHYHLGRAETDDVICNTLGCAIGTLSYSLSDVITHIRYGVCKKEKR